MNAVMKRVLAIGLLGLMGVCVAAQDTVVDSLSAMGLIDPRRPERAIGAEEGGGTPLFTEWLFGEAFRNGVVPAWLQSVGGESETVKAYAELHETRRDSDALLDEGKRLAQHMEAKETAMKRMVAHEIGLLEAAETYRAHDRAYSPGKPSKISLQYPGDTELEKYCNRIIRELEMLVYDHPQYRDALARSRLELRSLKSQGSLVSSD